MISNFHLFDFQFSLSIFNFHVRFSIFTLRFVAHGGDSLSFHSQTGFPVITPKNVEKFVKHVQENNFTVFTFQEICSDSSRLTFYSFLDGQCPLFPVDYRYGWNLRNNEHRKLLTWVYSELTVLYNFSPTCRPWSRSSNRTPPQDLVTERERETPHWAQRGLDSPGTCRSLAPRADVGNRPCDCARC